ncbi:hypothetical protein ACVBKF_30495, partial [Shewanella sp. 0m-11]
GRLTQSVIFVSGCGRIKLTFLDMGKVKALGKANSKDDESQDGESKDGNSRTACCLGNVTTSLRNAALTEK